MKKRFYSVVRNLKQRKYGDVVVNGMLVLLTADTVINKQYISLLAAWRKKVLRYIPSTRPITKKGTREWLQKKVIEERDRLLFFVVADNRPIGHVGLYRYNAKNNSIVVDNVIRGVAGHPGIMGEALLAMIRWAKKTLHIRTFLVDCSSNNEKAIALYKRIGFCEIRREPLIRVKTKGGYVFKDAPVHHTGIIKYYRVIFVMPDAHE